MRRSTRKFAGTSVIIGFVPVYALVAMALAQARPVQEAAVLIQVLCYAALGLASIAPAMPLIRWMETRSGNVKSSVRFVIKPHPTRGSAATRPAGQ